MTPAACACCATLPVWVFEHCKSAKVTATHSPASFLCIVFADCTSELTTCLGNRFPCLFCVQVDASVPLFGYIGRLEEQKGVDILIAALPQALKAGKIQVAILGTGKQLLLPVPAAPALLPSLRNLVPSLCSVMMSDGSCPSLYVPVCAHPCMCPSL